jgi:hypothetical protein
MAKISLGGALVSSGVGLADIGMEEVTNHVDERFPNVIKLPGLRPHDIFRHSLEATSLVVNKSGGGEYSAAAFYSIHPLWMKSMLDGIRYIREVNREA